MENADMKKMLFKHLRVLRAFSNVPAFSTLVENADMQGNCDVDQGLWKLLKVEAVQFRGHSLSPWKNSNISICHFGNRKTELCYIFGGSAPVYNNKDILLM